ncbi:heme-binding HmuY-like protein [Chitinophaga skermanii]|uniref:Heme-binding HmuY-like protein n=1 Tax=Chitinophaga skermanii TaxID=331697 RepID=A0A327QSP0_9BACT|nr:HmuY family protein [Chitinophaga skermanii]RAJ06654.1 heme-binding HmuY-like protein [Chitinophaga skermanii]
MLFTIKRQAAILLLIGSVVMTACSKENNDTTPAPGPTGPSVATGVYTVTNLVADTSANSGGNAEVLYYSLEENKVIPASQRQTGNWDICFYGIYNSSVYPNNSGAVGSPGFGGPGKAKIYVTVDRKFDAQYYDTLNFKPKTLPIPRALWTTAFAAVKTADESNMQTRDIGLDHYQNEFDGWGYYDFYGTLFPGNEKKTHVVYALPRVMIVKTHKGHYAKLIIENIYKDSPIDPNRDNKPGYVTFTYAIQMDGSTNLDIK